MKVKLTDRLGKTIKETNDSNQCHFSLEQSYGFEDEIHIETQPNSFLTISLDKHIQPATVYTPSGKIHYVIPAGWKTKALHPQAFKDMININVVKTDSSVISSRRNLAFNSLDKRWDTGYFPHASANVVTRDEPWFEAKNAIDGYLNRDGHGPFPYQSWGGGLRDDLEFRLDFGRPVLIDEIHLYLRADFTDNHDIHWESGILEFSDGHQMTIHMSGNSDADIITFQEKKTHWIKLHHLKREINAAFSALTQIEVYGREG